MTGEAPGPKDLAALQDELRYLLNRWDPIGVYDEALNLPPDEYECLLSPLLTRLARSESRAAFSEYLWHEVEDHFGLDPVRCGTDPWAQAGLLQAGAIEPWALRLDSRPWR